MDEISKPLNSQQVGLLPHDKADGVHEVGLARPDKLRWRRMKQFFPYRPVGADHSHEGLERSYLLVASVGFEVVHLDILLLEDLALDVIQY